MPRKNYTIDFQNSVTMTYRRGLSGQGHAAGNVHVLQLANAVQGVWWVHVNMLNRPSHTPSAMVCCHWHLCCWPEKPNPIFSLNRTTRSIHKIDRRIIRITATNSETTHVHVYNITIHTVCELIVYIVMVNRWSFKKNGSSCGGMFKKSIACKITFTLLSVLHLAVGKAPAILQNSQPLKQWMAKDVATKKNWGFF